MSFRDSKHRFEWKNIWRKRGLIGWWQLARCLPHPTTYYPLTIMTKFRSQQKSAWKHKPTINLSLVVTIPIPLETDKWNGYFSEFWSWAGTKQFRFTNASWKTIVGYADTRVYELSSLRSLWPLSRCHVAQQALQRTFKRKWRRRQQILIVHTCYNRAKRVEWRIRKNANYWS